MTDRAVVGRAPRTADPVRWRFGTFGPASEEPYRRRPRDYLQLVAAAIVLTFAVLEQGHPTQTERNVFALFNGLPDDLRPLFSTLYRLGALWAVALFAVAAFVAHRRRLARDLAIAAVATWIVGRLLGAFVSEHATLGDGVRVLTRIDSGPSFPLVPVAVITAVICAAGPYVMRPVRRGGQAVVLVLALAAFYLGTGFPNDVLAAVALGWGVAAGVHLIFGSPGGRPTRAQVRVALAELGLTVHDVELAPYVRQDGTVMYALDDRGRVHVRVLGRDEADVQVLAKFWRFALYKDGGPDVHLTRLEDVEQEALALLLAERAGALVPSVLTVGTAGRGTALLATRAPEGPRLAEMDRSAVTDDTLRTLWHTVGLMQDAGISHGHLNVRHVVLTDRGPEVVDFSDASSRRSDGLLRADIAELLVSSATIVGEHRAVSCALDVLGADALVAALPYLQTPALSREMPSHLPRERRSLRDTLTTLRGVIADATGTEPPQLQQLYRANATNVLMAIGSLAAVGVLLSQIGDPGEFWSTISAANWWWLLLAFALSLSTNAAAAVALAGTVPVQLPLWRTAELQLSMSFSNLAVPAVGGVASQVRFLQKQGVDAASAVAAGVVLSTAANLATYLALFGLAVALAPDSIDTGNIPASSIAWALLAIVAVLLLVAGVIRLVPKLRSRVVPQLRRAASTIMNAVRSPRQLLEMVAGNALNALLYALVLLCSIRAFGGSANFWTVLALNIFVGTIASAIPIPGGDAAVRSLGLSGALSAVGVATPVAVAAVLANQLVSNYLPAFPGWIATKDLLAHDYL
jgi:glycosyltransferase 2 family protein